MNSVLYMLTKERSCLASTSKIWLEVNLLWLCYRVWIGATNHVTKYWYSSTLKVTFIWQPARLRSRGLWYSAAIFRWDIAADAEHESSLSGPALGDKTISLSVCTYKSHRLLSSRECKPRFEGSSKRSTLSAVTSALLILIALQEWRGRMFAPPQRNTGKKCFALMKRRQVQDLF